MNSYKPNLQVGAAKGKRAWYGSLCNQQQDQNVEQDNISRVLHSNESQRDFIELQKIIQMSIINDTQFEIIFHGSRILQGQDYHLHIEYYKNNTLAPDIQPWTIIVRFAGTGVCYFIIFARWGKTKILIKFTKQSGHCRLLQD